MTYLLLLWPSLSLGSGNAFLSELQQKVVSRRAPSIVRSEPPRCAPASVCRSLLLHKDCYCILLFRARSGRSWIRGAWLCLSVWDRPRSRRSFAGWAFSHRAGDGMHPECRRHRSNARDSGTGPSVAAKECTRTREPLHTRTSSAGCLKHTQKMTWTRQPTHSDRRVHQIRVQGRRKKVSIK